MNNQINQIRTSTLFNRLLKSSNLEQFMKDNAYYMQLMSFSEYITELCKKQGQVPEHIIKRGNIERSYGHQLFKGTRKPSRDTVLQLAFGFDAGVETAQELLKHARMSSLYPRVKRDAAIIYCLHNHFTIVEVQSILYEMKLILIGRGELK
ncbi:MAG: hypothetical protein PHT02_09685 [Tissierellia bacterium]|nr:hypothetical protein [Tissierellia bacterium]